MSIKLIWEAEIGIDEILAQILILWICGFVIIIEPLVLQIVESIILLLITPIWMICPVGEAA